MIATKGGFERPGPGRGSRTVGPSTSARPATAAWGGSGSTGSTCTSCTPDPNVPVRGVDRRPEGAAGRGQDPPIGISNVTSPSSTRAPIVDSCRCRTATTSTTAARRTCSTRCERRGLAFIPWFPLATGRLAQPGGPLDEIAEAHRATPGQIALAWLLKRSPVMLPIPGTSSVEHLEENVDAAAIELTEADFETISRISS